MRAASTAVSLTTHVLLVVAALWATARAHPRVPPPHVIIDVSPFPSRPINAPAPPVPGAPVIGGDVSIPLLSPPVIEGIDIARVTPGFDVHPMAGLVLTPATPVSGDPIDISLVDQLPVMLAGPVPAYPDLLRQAGIQGRVVLEAVVDTVGHVEPGSIVVVATAHPGFVAGAQRAIAATLFRPARVHGRAVRVRVRIPVEFALRR